MKLFFIKIPNRTGQPNVSPTATPTPTPAPAIILHTANISGTDLTITYSKNFNGCVHLLREDGANQGATTGICSASNNIDDIITVTQPLAGFPGILAGIPVKLCSFSPDPEVCSNVVTVTEGANECAYLFDLGDANEDGAVDGIDYARWFNHYLENTSSMPVAQRHQVGDFNRDGTVDLIDYVRWLNHYLEQCVVGPTPTPTPKHN